MLTRWTQVTVAHTRDPGGSESVRDPGHVALPERAQEVIDLVVAEQLRLLLQLLVQLAVGREEEDPGEEEALAHWHSAPPQVLTQVGGLGLR